MPAYSNIVKTIGADGSFDFSTIAAFIAAAPTDLKTPNSSYIGILHDDKVYTDIDVDFPSATGGNAHRFILRSAVGQKPVWKPEASGTHIAAINAGNWLFDGIIFDGENSTLSGNSLVDTIGSPAFTNCTFRNSPSTGLITRGRNPVVNCLFHDNVNHGVANGSNAGSRISQCGFIDNGLWGAIGDNSPLRMFVTNSWAFNNGSGSFAFMAVNDSLNSYNTVDDTVFTAEGLGRGNNESESLPGQGFISTPAFDFRLTGGSVLRDAGGPITFFAVAFDDLERKRIKREKAVFAAATNELRNIGPHQADPPGFRLRPPVTGKGKRNNPNANAFRVRPRGQAVE